MGKGTNFLAGVLAGGAIGAGLTILIVPELDAEARQRLRDEAVRWRARTEQLLALAKAEAPTFVERAQASLDKIRARLSEAVGEARAAAAETRQELQGKFERALREGEAQL